MISFRHQSQVRGIVIRGIVVDMVDHLVWAYIATKALLGDEPVLHNVPLGIRVWVLRHQPCTVPATSPISDESPVSRFASLVCNATLKAAKFLRTLPSMAYIFPTLTATVRRRLPPTPNVVALSRAISGRVLAAIFGVKGRSTLLAMERDRGSFHVSNITPEEHYCEIAVKRLGQEVLDL